MNKTYVYLFLFLKYNVIKYFSNWLINSNNNFFFIKKKGILSSLQTENIALPLYYFDDDTYDDYPSEDWIAM